MMQQVGNELARWAQQKTKEVDFDAFGRSAFNRYYYASFLVVREMLVKLDPSWGQERHSNIPGLLKISILKRIKNEIRKQSKAGFPKNEHPRHPNSAILGLADLLESANKIRVDADYFPEKKVSFENGKLMLSNTTLSSAENWLKQTKRFTGEILYIWRQLGLS
jgi:hypothetical protein